MPTTRIARTSFIAAAAAVALVAIATPAHAGWHVGVSATIVAPPLVVSVGNAVPVAPYGYYSPTYVPYVAPYPAGCAPYGYYAPTYAPYPAPYPAGAAVVVAPAAGFVRVWVPGPRPHWEMRRAARFHRRHW